jgi:hypothetical protein
VKKIVLVSLTAVFVLVSVLPTYGASEAFWIAENQRLTAQVQALQRERARLHASIQATYYANMLPVFDDFLRLYLYLPSDSMEESILINNVASFTGMWNTILHDFDRPDLHGQFGNYTAALTTGGEVFPGWIW